VAQDLTLLDQVQPSASRVGQLQGTKRSFVDSAKIALGLVVSSSPKSGAMLSGTRMADNLGYGAISL